MNTSLTTTPEIGPAVSVAASVEHQSTREANSPASRPPLFGRERELAGIAELLEHDDIPVLTLTGPGGVGKTRLAFEIAARLGGRFADGAHVASLAATRDPDLIPAAIGRALGVREGGDGPLSQRLVEHLRERELLLVLDNFEHVLDAAGLVADLAAAAPKLKVLVTSRARLRLSREQVFPVEPLRNNVEGAASTGFDPGSAPAATLFVTRARAVRPDFVPSEDDAAAILAICVRLDGLPLAIELAAARIDVLPPMALLARLDKRLPLLTGGPRDLPARLRTMRNAIAWSVDLLSPEEQTLFRRLAVFVGGCTLDAAAVVRTGDAELDVLSGVSALVDSSLLRTEPGPNDEPRFLMLETVREYASELLACHVERDVVQCAHASHLMNLAETALPLYDGVDAIAWMNRVEIELPNCHAALGWADSAGQHDILVRLTGALCDIWLSGGYPSDERHWLERALAARDFAPPQSVIQLLVGATAFFIYQTRDVVRALELGEELKMRAEADGGAYGRYWAHFQLGVILDRTGHLAESVNQFRLALDLAPYVRNPETHAAWATHDLAFAAFRQGDLAAAAEGHERTLAIHRATGHIPGVARLLDSYARVAMAQEDLASAARHLHESLQISRAIRANLGIGGALIGLAAIAAASGRPVTAARLLGSVEAMRRAGRLLLVPYVVDEEPNAIRTARRALGDAAYDRAWNEGLRLGQDNAVAEAAELAAAIQRDPKSKTLRQPNMHHGLTPRELDVLRELANGRSNREIGDALFIAERTVESHVTQVLSKLSVESRTAATAYAIRSGLV